MMKGLLSYSCVIMILSLPAAYAREESIPRWQLRAAEAELAHKKRIAEKQIERTPKRPRYRVNQVESPAQSPVKKPPLPQQVQAIKAAPAPAPEAPPAAAPRAPQQPPAAQQPAPQPPRAVRPDVQPPVYPYDDYQRVDPVKKAQKPAEKEETPEFLDNINAQVREEMRRNGKQALIDNPDDEEALMNLQLALLSKENGSAMITGKAGSGKTELIKTFVRKVMSGEYKGIPKNTQFLSLDGNSLQSGTKYTGEFQKKVEALIAAVKGKSPPVILVIDEAHTLRGAGTHSQNSNDFYNMIKPYISDGSVHIIGMTTEDEYNHHFGGDPALGRRLPPIRKSDPSLERIPDILKNWTKKKYGADHDFEEGVLAKIVDLSSRFDAVSSNMAKATRLTDRFHAYLKVKGIKPSDATHHDLEEAASQLYGMKREQFDEGKRKERLKALSENLEKDIKGNTELKKSLAEDALLILSDLHDQAKPQVRRALFGPPGTGKSSIAEAYARHMDLPFERIMLTQGNSKEDLINRVGNAIRKNPRTVILFDEIEKAPKEMQDALLDLMDSNYITMREQNGASGPKVSTEVQTRHASLFFASNAGGQVIKDNPEIKGEKLKNAILKDNFSRPLLDRMAGVHKLLPPSKDEMKSIFRENMAKAIAPLKERLGLEGITIKNNEKLFEKILSKTEDPEMGYGIRQAIVEVERQVRLSIAKQLQSTQYKNATQPSKKIEVEVDLNNI